MTGVRAIGRTQESQRSTLNAGATRKGKRGPLPSLGVAHAGVLAGGAHKAVLVRPNVRAKLPAEAGAVSLVRDDAPIAADQAYSACRSGSA
jgi:hypothetical protein